MARLALLLSSIILFSSCREKVQVYDLTSVSVRSARGITLVNDTIFTGTLISPFEIQSYIDGREHGTWKKFYPYKNIAEIRRYDHGKKTGVYQSWWENGQPRSEWHFSNDEYNGLCMDWSRTGQLIRKMNYKNGHEEGTQQMWDDDGTIRANYVAKNGRNYGLTGVKSCVSKF